jgi:hypothetical protein
MIVVFKTLPGVDKLQKYLQDQVQAALNLISYAGGFCS